MLITRLYLRNYRVYEQELDLPLPGGLVGVYGVNGAGKCLPGPTRVWDADTGEGVSIEQFVRERRKWILGYSEGQVRRVQVTDWYDVGPRPTVIVKLASGAELETATTHPILSDRGCLRAEDLKPGDWVAEARKFPVVASGLISNDEAFIVGVLLGDGCVTNKVRLSATDVDLISAYRSAVERTFPGCTVRTQRTTNTCVSALSDFERVKRRQALAHRLADVGVPVDAYLGSNLSRFVRGETSLSWETMCSIERDHGLDLWEEKCALHGGRALVEWIRSMGLLGADARSKHVPSNLLLLPDEQTAHLIAGLWLTDGYIGRHRAVAGGHAQVSYTTASPQLAHDVRVLLLRLGMTSTRTTRRVSGSTFYEIRLTAEAHRNLELLPLVGRKAELARQIVQQRIAVRPNPNMDTSREAFLDFGGSPAVADAETMWSRVASVTRTGHELPCFDVTVDTPEHLYLADTVIVHNSALIESVLWSLWGKSRTSKDQVRTSGVGGDCVTEVEFEHEGHLYLVRRTITGANFTVKAEAHCDRLLMAEGIRDTARYVHQVLGMDDVAFRASVFAEQKQLAAFSSQRPEERRRLVLQLLGITPLDAARDAARRDARESETQHHKLRDLLPDLAALQVAADDALALAEARETGAGQSEQAAEAAAGRAAEAESAFHRLDMVRQEYDGLVIEGRAAKSELDGIVARVTALSAELAELDAATEQLAVLEPAAEGLAGVETRLRLVEAVAAAFEARRAVVVPDEPAAPDEVALEATRHAAESAKAELAGVEGEIRAGREQLAEARVQAARSHELSGAADCPLCGQALGDAFEQVQAHRAAEVAGAEARLEALESQRASLVTAEVAARTLFAEQSRSLKASGQARSAWQQSVTRRTAAEEALAAALTAAGPSVDAAGAGAEVAVLRQDVAARRQAAATLARLQGRLERRPAVEADLDSARLRVADATGRVEALRDKVKTLEFDKDALERARSERDVQKMEADAAAKAAQALRLDAGRARALAEGEAKRLEEARGQHARLADLESDSRHLSRLADLLGAFRNGVVASVGPRLAVQAGDLFAELTDREYDRLEVDPETYELQIRDTGQVYGLDRFSGSEIDLANLALRVAISEHVRFQSGGSVGLLVLDEVFGPLDDERKGRMLLALERLRGRFRQVLVVTHAGEIKEQLPNAIEVVKLPGRRATARVLNRE